MRLTQPKHLRPRRGLALVYTAVMVCGMFAIGSLAMDFGRAEMVKTELARCADAAARAAVASISSGVTTAQTAAVNVAAANLADGYAVVLDPSKTGSNADIEFGTWSTGAKTFTVLSGAAQSTANAIRVTTRRMAARGTGVPMTLASIIGFNSIDVKAQSIVSISYHDTGITGLSSIAIHANLFVASYNSGTTTTPSHSTYNSNGVLGSNGQIGTGAGSGNALYGTAIEGPSGSLNAGVTASNTTTLTTALVTPADPTFTPVTNPGSVSATPNVSGTVTWPGGTYYFTSFTMANTATLSFSGPATIYLNGNGTINDHDTITAYNSIPGNLVIYQVTGKTFTIHDNGSFTFDYQGPGDSMTFHDSDYFAGSIIAGTLTFHDNDSVYYDEAQGPGTSINSISLVK